MKRERDEDIFDAMVVMANDIHYRSRNYNQELIGIDYYRNLHTLSKAQLQQLDLLWAKKARNCYKEKLASQWFIAQLLLLIGVSVYVAMVLNHPFVSVTSFIVSATCAVLVIDDKRVRVAKANLRDARGVHEHIQRYL
jgi:hypothetical protein